MVVTSTRMEENSQIIHMFQGNIQENTILRYSVIFVLGGNHDYGYRVGYVSIITSTHPHTFNNFNSSEPEALDSLCLCLVLRIFTVSAGLLSLENLEKMLTQQWDSSMAIVMISHIVLHMNFIAFENRTIITCI